MWPDSPKNLPTNYILFSFFSIYLAFSSLFFWGGGTSFFAFLTFLPFSLSSVLYIMVVAIVSCQATCLNKTSFRRLMVERSGSWRPTSVLTNPITYSFALYSLYEMRDSFRKLLVSNNSNLSQSVSMSHNDATGWI